MECCIMCGIHADIDSMPMGYESLIVESGRNVSGGQKQRILIARSLYRRPSILILDEATSHLDVDTERSIAETLKQLKLTRILVAHRPQTIAVADRIVELTAISRNTLGRNERSTFPPVPSFTY
jgi:ATP-binding cassette, subfamily B, bacterial CvaB/MchF/RaxB